MAFLSKKQRRLMRARRKKRKVLSSKGKTTTENGANNELSMEVKTKDKEKEKEGEQKKTEELIVTKSDNMGKEKSTYNSPRAMKKRKRSNSVTTTKTSVTDSNWKIVQQQQQQQSQLTAQKKENQQAVVIKVKIPPGLTPKEVRKFRKDARRKLRREAANDHGVNRFASLTNQSEDEEEKKQEENKSEDNNNQKNEPRDQQVTTNSEPTIVFVTEEEDEEYTTTLTQTPLGLAQKDAPDAPPSSTTPSSDDLNLQTKIVPQNSLKRTKKTFPSINDILAKQKQQQTKQSTTKPNLSPEEAAKYLAMDCEMVGVGADGKRSAVARVCVVNWDLQVVLDTYVEVPERVTDFRTWVSGILPHHIRRDHPDHEGHGGDKEEGHNTNKPQLMNIVQVRKRLLQLFENKVIIGHALRNDFAALLLDFPSSQYVRDTARYPPFERLVKQKIKQAGVPHKKRKTMKNKRGGESDSENDSSSGEEGDGETILVRRPRKLKDLAKEFLRKDIQKLGSPHDPVEDARSAMELYQLERGPWEKEVALKAARKRSGGGGKKRRKKRR